MVTHLTKKCAVCGREFGPGTVYCPYDGRHLEIDGGTAPPPQEPRTVERPVAPEAPEAPAPARDAGDSSLIGYVIERRYRILEPIGRGGMGTVYRAIHTEFNRNFAIKILNMELVTDSVAIRRFRREAQALGAISHPNAVSISDFGITDEGIAFLVMEILEGRSLRSVITKEAPLPLPRIARILRQVCGAVSAAHRVGVIHRDLKPDNIMLIRTEGEGETAKVLDFGIAKLRTTDRLTSRLTARDVVVGTPRYMSPEACEGRELTPATDVYALGIILYEMLTGQAPFEGDTAIDIAVQQVNDPPPPPSRFRADLPAEVEAVVLRALAKQPEFRQRRATELAEQFDAAVRASAQVASRATAPIVHEAELTGSRARTTVETSPLAVQAQPATPAPPPPADDAWLTPGLVVGLLALGGLIGVAIVALLVWITGPVPPGPRQAPRQHEIQLQIMAPPVDRSR